MSKLKTYIHPTQQTKTMQNTKFLWKLTIASGTESMSYVFQQQRNHVN